MSDQQRKELRLELDFDSLCYKHVFVRDLEENARSDISFPRERRGETGLEVKSDSESEKEGGRRSEVDSIRRDEYSLEIGSQGESLVRAHV